MNDRETAIEAAAAWEANADAWAERLRTDSDWVRRVILDEPHLALLGDVAGRRALDAGCGEGRFARMLADRGAAVTAFDLSPTMIAHARAREASAPRGIDLRVADVCDLAALATASFDVVVAYLSLIDVEDLARATREIGRVLVPGGQLVFSILHPCFAVPGAEWEPAVPGTIPMAASDFKHLKVDRYFPARPVRVRLWPTAPAESIHYHRPLQDYTRALRGGGLRVCEIVEPTPSATVADPFGLLQPFFRVPSFMVLDCVRAASTEGDSTAKGSV